MPVSGEDRVEIDGGDPLLGLEVDHEAEGAQRAEYQAQLGGGLAGLEGGQPAAADPGRRGQAGLGEAEVTAALPNVLTEPGAVLDAHVGPPCARTCATECT